MQSCIHFRRKSYCRTCLVFRRSEVYGMKFKCRDCGEEFDEFEVTEWLNDDDEEDDEGENPCCPHCGSDDVKEL